MSDPEIILGKSQQRAFDDAMAGHNMFITGAGGVGKSVVIRKIVEELRKRNKKVAITASTGIAGVNVGGTTIHSLLGLGIYKNKYEAEKKAENHKFLVKMQQRLAGLDVIIIDEISMLTGDYVDMMDWWLRRMKPFEAHTPFGDVQIIFVGDFLQLPAVIKHPEEVERKFAFQSKIWKRADIKVHLLKKNYRQGADDTRWHLNRMRFGVVLPETVEYFKQCVGRKLSKSRTRLVSTNKEAYAINFEMLNKIPGEEQEFVANLDGHEAWQSYIKDNCLAETHLYLKVGVPVIVIKNNWDMGYYNGMVGIVREITPMAINIELKNGEMKSIIKETWEVKDFKERVLASLEQWPLKLAAAITIHKSQGLTLEEMECDLNKCFEVGQAYVALSRMKSIEGLSLTTPLNKRMVMVDPEVKAFYKELYSREKQKQQE